MKHRDIAEQFAKGSKKAKGSRIFIDEDTIYSYGYHFPIAVRHEGIILFNSKNYSNSTSTHKSHVRRALEHEGHKIIELKGCDLKQIEEQTKQNNNDIEIAEEKLLRARTTKETWKERIDYLLKQNELLNGLRPALEVAQ